MSPGAKALGGVALMMAGAVAVGSAIAGFLWVFDHLWPRVGGGIAVALIMGGVAAVIYWAANADARDRGEKW